MIETHPFEIFIPRNISHLILGSFTSKDAIKGTNYDWYYSNGRNQFWHIISRVYNIELKDKESKQKLFEQLELGIADIIYQCERRDGNSLDMNLVNIVVNPDLERIIRSGRIKTILFSSRYVEKLFAKHFKHIVSEFPNIKLVTLPSPSPRYAAMSKNEKIKKYIELLPKLNL
jgi:TDG/mug DNA glycosylase family protein